MEFAASGREQIDSLARCTCTGLGTTRQPTEGIREVREHRPIRDAALSLPRLSGLVARPVVAFPELAQVGLTGLLKSLIHGVNFEELFIRCRLNEFYFHAACRFAVSTLSLHPAIGIDVAALFGGLLHDFHRQHQVSSGLGLFKHPPERAQSHGSVRDRLLDHLAAEAAPGVLEQRHPALGQPLAALAGWVVSFDVLARHDHAKAILNGRCDL